MAVVVTSVSPSSLSSGGKTMVEVLGSGFRLPTTPPASSAGPLPAPKPSVRVYFGNVEALRVRVVSTTRLLVTTPIHDLGTFDVRVVNVDDFGAPIDVGLLANACSFVLPDFTKIDEDFSRLVRTFMRELKRQVCPEVVFSSSVDWDDDPTAVLRTTTIAKTPALTLALSLRDTIDAAFRDAGPTFVPEVGGLLEAFSPRVVDLVFTINVVAESLAVTLNLVQAMISFGHRNKVLTMPRDAADPLKGTVSYDLELEAVPNIDASPNDDDLLGATGAIISLRKFDMRGMPGIPGDLLTTRHPTVEEVITGAEALAPVDENA